MFDSFENRGASILKQIHGCRVYQIAGKMVMDSIVSIERDLSASKKTVKNQHFLHQRDLSE